MYENDVNDVNDVNVNDAGDVNVNDVNDVNINDVNVNNVNDVNIVDDADMTKLVNDKTDLLTLWSLQNWPELSLLTKTICP